MRPASCTAPLLTAWGPSSLSGAPPPHCMKPASCAAMRAACGRTLRSPLAPMCRTASYSATSSFDTAPTAPGSSTAAASASNMSCCIGTDTVAGPGARCSPCSTLVTTATLSALNSQGATCRCASRGGAGRVDVRRGRKEGHCALSSQAVNCGRASRGGGGGGGGTEGELKGREEGATCPAACPPHATPRGHTVPVAPRCSSRPHPNTTPHPIPNAPHAPAAGTR
eukprot:365241-Chlamydomonas_euryale.AAC.20